MITDDERANIVSALQHVDIAVSRLLELDQALLHSSALRTALDRAEDSGRLLSLVLSDSEEARPLDFSELNFGAEEY